MNELNINLLEPEQKPKRKIWPYLLGGLVVVLILSAAIISSASIFGQPDDSLESGTDYKPGFLTQVKNLILSPDRKLQGEEEDRVNVLLLGIGGQGHDGAYLTDTIILASVKPSTQQIALLSIPRDLLVEIPGYGFRRINEANSFGELQSPGRGSRLAKEVVEKVIGLPIHYYLQIDFEGFKKMIDEVGGINIYVERSFEDYKFPTSNYKYRVVSFKQGWQKMDGQTALDFARSRHGNNGEGNDFARSRRQQKVLKALKEEVFSFSTFFNPSRLPSLFEQLNTHIQTNVELREINRAYKLAKKLDYENIINRVLAAGENEPLVESQFGGASVLVPRTGNFEEVQRLARHLFTLVPSLAEGPQNPVPSPASPQPKIQIQNGTWLLGLAAETKVNLEQRGIAIEAVGNAKIRNQEKTIIYDYSAGKFPETVNRLKEELKAGVVSNPPASLTDTIPAPDILVILGKDTEIP